MRCAFYVSAVTEIWGLVAPMPHGWSRSLAVEGICTDSVLLMSATSLEVFSGWVVAERLLAPAEARTRIVAAGRLSWQAAIVEVNPGVVVAFRGDGRADPDECAAIIGDLPTAAI